MKIKLSIVMLLKLNIINKDELKKKKKNIKICKLLKEDSPTIFQQF